MDKIWDTTIEYLAKVNNWIPLVAVLFAGLGLVAVTLILAISGCIARKRLVPHWLIWTYFTFALIVIVAHVGNDLAAIVEAMEIPVLVVLVCYILRAIFYRRPRYCYISEAAYAREVAKGRVYKVKPNEAEAVKRETVVEEDDGEEIEEVRETKADKKAKKEAAKKAEREARENEKLKAEQEKAAKKAARDAEKEAEQKAADEAAAREAELREIEKAEREAEEARRVAAEQAAREAREMEKAAQEAELAARENERIATTRVVRTEPTPSTTRRVDKTDFYTARTISRPTTTSTISTVDLPTVNPIPDKSYEPMREPTIVAKSVSETMPDLKMPKSTIQLRSSSYTSSVNRTAPRPTTTSTVRPTATSSLATRSSTLTRPTTTVTSSQASPNRTVRTETTTAAGNNAYTSMYNPRIVRTTTTTTNTNTDRLEAVTNSRTVNGNTTSSTSVKLTTNGQTPRSTEDVMAAIERLRASMKK